VIEERRVGSNSHFSNGLWQLGEGAFQQRNRKGRNVSIAGVVAALPTILVLPSKQSKGR
jgi:hypothetical protein